jgi:hypothetical protein
MMTTTKTAKPRSNSNRFISVIVMTFASTHFHVQPKAPNGGVDAAAR